MSLLPLSPEFTAKQRNSGERCFVYDEDGELTLELKRPADLAHAQAVEKFLNDNVDEIKSDPDSLPPTGFRV